MAESNLHTMLCEMLAIKYPIVLAGMGSASGPALTAAVSNAGGLGVLGAIDLEADQLREWIQETKRLTNKPFGVDTVFPAGLPETGKAEDIKEKLPEEGLAFAEKMRNKIGAPRVKGRPGQRVVSRKVIEEQVEVILDEKVPVLVSGLGDPRWAIPDSHERGITVMAVVGSVKAAQNLTEGGVDAIIAQGSEGGGHTGRVGTFVLTPQIVDAVNPMPVLAAGGVGDGRGLVAALALGAVGVWVGTALVATHEACIDHVKIGEFTQDEIDVWKQKILSSTAEDARITKLYTGKTLRMLSNSLTDMWEKEKGPYLPMPLQMALMADLQQGIREGGLKEYYGWTPAGQGTGMITELKSVEQVISQMVTETVFLLKHKLPPVVDDR